MKKLSLIAFVAALSLASCAKDRICTCTNTNSANSNSTTTAVTLVDNTNYQAKVNCLSTTKEQNGVTYTSDCSLN